MLKKIPISKLFLFFRSYKIVVYLILILSVGLYFRSFNVDWDSGYNFHPDERAIIMFTIPLQLPTSFDEFISPQSPLNPKFFAYGNFPLYLLKALSIPFSYFNPMLSEYGELHLVGRWISILADLATIFVIYLIGKLLFSKRTGLFGALLYTCSTFAIQLSHFYAVDTLLTFFMTTFLFVILKFLKERTLKFAMLSGILLGFSLATKISSLILLVTCVIAVVFYLLNQRRRLFVVKTYNPIILLILFSGFIFIATQPYVLIDFQEFVKQTTLQSQMGSDPFIFPYTLQYVGKISYLHELKNIILYGQGIVISFLCLIGTIAAITNLFLGKFKKHLLVGLLLFYGLFYFIVFGNFSVGWMRYMLPIYPILAILGGYFISEIATPFLQKHLHKNYIFNKAILLTMILLVTIYPLSFLSIYTKPNTRIQASVWIHENVPAGSAIAVEHWDDAIPVYGIERYQQLTLPLYEPDTKEKWEHINSILQHTDYIFIASNRLYVPLQKLTDCQKLPPGKCYTITAQYYKDLFKEKRGFHKIAEFSEFPTLPFTNISFNDQKADESFTVYDHPRILIFKKD